MEQNERTILSAMDSIVTLSHHETIINHRRTEHYDMSDALFELASDDLAFLASEYHISKRQAALFCVIVQLCKDDEITKSDLSDKLKDNFASFLTLQADIKKLESLRLLRRCRFGRFRVTEEALAELEENRAYVAPPITDLTTFQILSRMSKIVEGIDEKIIDRIAGQNDIDALILANPKTCIAQVADEYGILTFNDRSNYVGGAYPRKDYLHSMDRPLRMMFYAMCYRYHEYSDDEVRWKDLCDCFAEDELVMLQSSVRADVNPLFQNKILTFSERDGTVVKDSFMIDNEVKEKMLADAGGLHEKSILTDVIHNTDITSKELFFDADEQEQIDSLGTLLRDERYREVCGALKEKGLRSGFACLFYGSPGTGKTETVYQLARDTGRDLIVADIAKLKSCWVGESEKNVRGLFRKYKRCVKESKITPILLFNEADAIFGIRRSGADKAVEKMENSIQNIILQEMEDLEGILIATTNLTENLDKAFERRFLYKINFDKPSPRVRSKIWQSMIPELDEAQAVNLSERFDFSGGQIENVSRKKTVHAILSGKEVGFDEMLKFCEEENIGGRHSSKIGF